jgi:hypothetical protein
MPEIMLRHEYELREHGSNGWRTEVFKPDAYVQLRDRSGNVHHFFAEVDCGNVSAAKFAEKAATYARYRDAELFAKQFGAGDFAVLVVTTGLRRIQNLVHAARAVIAFNFTTFDAVLERGPLDAVWRTPPDISVERAL